MLKRRRGGVDIPTTMPTATPAAPSPMRIALTLLLNGAKGSREAFRHLAAVENDLGRKDGQGRFLFEVPADQLKVVLRQLDGLIGGRNTTAALAELRGCLVDAIKSREKHDLREELRQPISSFFVDDKLQVSEVALSEFDALHAAWTGSAPPAAPSKT